MELAATSQNKKIKPKLPTAVIWLGVVSLATDASSEMIYPLLPLFLSTLGAGPAFIGVVEGAAEATASLLKLVAGQISDRSRRRKPLTLFGYGISSTVRPLAALATHPWMILVVRLADRVGKGVRSSPRDALLADVTPLEERGRAFGFHQAMDNAGAVIGPLLATALLAWGHLPLRSIFAWAVVPGVMAMAALFAVREPKSGERAPKSAPSTVERTDRHLLRYLVVVGLFSLGNSSDAFLLLRAQQLGVATRHLPLLWMLHNAVKAALSTAGGALSDRVGRRLPLALGWLIYSATYLGFGVATSAWQMWGLFAVYGLYYSLVEGTQKALISDLVPATQRGRAFGWYYLVVGLVALPASFSFGWLVDRYGARVPFTASAILAGSAALLLTLVPLRSRQAN